MDNCFELILIIKLIVVLNNFYVKIFFNKTFLIIETFVEFH